MEWRGESLLRVALLKNESEPLLLCRCTAGQRHGWRGGSSRARGRTSRNGPSTALCRGFRRLLLGEKPPSDAASVTKDQASSVCGQAAQRCLVLEPGAACAAERGRKP